MFLSFLAKGAISSSICECDKTDNLCDIYCSCDPECTSGVVETFPFSLPSTIKPNFTVSCDPYNFVKKTNKDNSFSIIHSNKKLMCYSAPAELSDSDTFKTIDVNTLNISEYNGTNVSLPEDYSQKDLYIPEQPIKAIRGGKTLYYSFPIGIGSAYCNSFYFISYDTNMPSSSCLLPLAHLSEYDPSIYSIYLFPTPKSDNSSYTNFPSFSTKTVPLPDFDGESNDIHYSIGIVGSNGQISSAFSSLINSYSPFDTIISNSDDGSIYEHISLGSEIKWFNSTKTSAYLNEMNTIHSTGPTGYLIGYPLQVETANNVLEVIKGLIVNFGENTITKLYIENQWNKFKSLLITSGQTIQDADTTSINLNYPENYEKMKDVKWTFYYKKIGKKSMPVNIIIDVKITAENPRKTENEVELLTFQSEFIRLNENGTDIYRENDEVRLNYYTVSSIFDFFFKSNEDIITTSAIFCIFVFITTIWVYSGFCLH